MSPQETHTRILKEDLEALKAIHSSTGRPISQVLHDLLTGKEPIQTALTLVNLRQEDYNKLQLIMQESGFTDIGNAIHSVMQSQTTLEVVTPAKVMETNVPVVLGGRPLSGKSHWLKNTFIPAMKDNSVLVIDANSEYEFLSEIKSIREIGLSTNNQARYVPVQHSIMGTMQVKALFTELNMQIDLDKESLKNLVLIVEEGQSYKSSWFNGFLYKSRHILRKMIVVTPQIDCFQGLKIFTVYR